MLWLTYGGLLILFFVEIFGNHSFNKKLPRLIVVIVLSVLAGGRTGFGVDYEEYVKIFVAVPPLSGFFFEGVLQQIHGEYGFLFLCSLLKTIGLDYRALFLLIAVLSVSINILAVKKIGGGLFAAVLIYYSHNYFLKEFGQIRNGLSSALLVLAAFSLIEKKNKRFLLLVVAASLVHEASLIFLLAYVVRKLRFEAIGFFIILAFLLGASHWLSAVLVYVEPILPNLLVFYINSEYFKNIGLDNPQTLKQLLFCVAFFWFVAQFSKNRILNKNSGYYVFRDLAKIYSASVFFLFLFVEFDILGRRLASYFGSVEPVLVAQLLCLLQQRNKRAFLAVAALVACYATVTMTYNLSLRPGFDGAYRNWLFS